MSTREKELLSLINHDKLLIPLVSDMVTLEEQLEYLRTLPKIKVHPKDPTKQKATPAAKLYKESLQQYTNILRILMRATGTDVDDEESPLRKWFNEHMDTG
jgi:hypothetical protein